MNFDFQIMDLRQHVFHLGLQFYTCLHSVLIVIALAFIDLCRDAVHGEHDHGKHASTVRGKPLRNVRGDTRG